MNEPFHCAHRFQDNNGIKSPRVIMAAIVIFFSAENRWKTRLGTGRKASSASVFKVHRWKFGSRRSSGPIPGVSFVQLRRP
jgi:hypothetical protein